WVPVLNYSRRRGTEGELQNRSSRSVIVMGRLAPRASLSEAQAEFDTISTRLQTAYPDADRNTSAVLRPYSASAFSPATTGTQGRAFMAIVTVVALLTLVIVCANVANLMLARTAARQRELAVRQSIGASRLRIVRLLLAESLVISLVALIAAGCLTVWASHAVVRLLPPNGAGVRLDPDFTPDGRVTAYAMLLALLSALAFTLAPAVRAWRQELLPWLKAGEHSVIQGRSGLAKLLVIAQLALCVLLLTGAGLAYRSVSLLNSRDLHFDKNHLLLASVSTAGAVRAKDQNIALLERLRKRLLAVPGVVSASYARAAPPRDAWSGPVKTPGSEQSVRADGNFAGPDYLTALGVWDLMGRGITEHDITSKAHPVVINRNLAAALWPGQSALGRTLLAGPKQRPMEVVGVTPNGAFSGIERDTHDGRLRNFIFFSEREDAAASGLYEFHVRYAGKMDAIAPALRAAFREVDGRVPVSFVRTMQTHMEQFTSPAELLSTLLGLFGVGALLLAAIGLYAVVAFHTAAR
ncbi:MAG: FtsX-like permease family protein, partial [Bryobacteraceae bacterium]